jgi:hypothetical protein
MSMNIHIEAVREAIAVKTGEHFTDTLEFPAWQTSTKDTRSILAAPLPVAAYIDVIRTYRVPYEQYTYAEDDIFGEGDPVNTRIVDDGADHAEYLMQWIADVTARGFEVDFSGY